MLSVRGIYLCSLERSFSIISSRAAEILWARPASLYHLMKYGRHRCEKQAQGWNQICLLLLCCSGSHPPPPKTPQTPPQTPLSYSLVCRQRCGSSQTSPSFSSFGGSWKKERVCNLITNVRKMFLELLVFTPRYISIRTVWFYVLLKRSTTVVHDAGGFIYLHCSLLFSSRRLNVVPVLNRIKCIHIENTAVVYLLRIKPAITVYGSARARIVSKKTWTFWRKGFASLRLFLSFLVKNKHEHKWRTSEWKMWCGFKSAPRLCCYCNCFHSVIHSK